MPLDKCFLAFNDTVRTWFLRTSRCDYAHKSKQEVEALLVSKGMLPEGLKEILSRVETEGKQEFTIQTRDHYELPPMV